ncbi:hypothetical protein GCM10027589_28150 [Actinocorallia lasiicapitis]
MESMIKANVNRCAAFAMGSNGYLPAFDLSLGGFAARRRVNGVILAPSMAGAQGWSGFNGMIIGGSAAVRPLQQLPVPTTVQAQKRHTEMLAPYPWRPPA